MNSLKRGCIDNQCEINKNIKVSNKIGTESIYAQVYKGCYPLNCTYPISLKKIPLEKKDIKYLNKPFSKTSIEKSMVFSELAILKMTNLLVQKGVCPHLPFVYRYYQCKKNKYVMVANELANGDLKDIITKIKPNIPTLKIIFFQIFLGIYCIKKYFNIHHNDLHWGNVLYHTIPKKGSIKYIIQGKSIVIPNTGFLPVLWDFGLSYIPGKIPDRLKGKNSDDPWEDYKRISSMLMKDSEQTLDSYEELYVWLLKFMSLFKTPEKFLLKFGEYLNTISKDNVKDNVIETFDTDKQVTSKDPFLKKSIIKQK